MTVVMRKIEFDAGHRLVNHESKCAHVHGHRYVAEFYCKADKLDSVGRVVDFSCIKEAMGTWIDDNWDHAMIFDARDDLLIEQFRKRSFRSFIMGCNPTAENMAAHLLRVANDLLGKYQVSCVKVRLWETPNCFAEVEL